MILNKETQRLVDRAAKELGIPKHVATVAYRSYWEFIKSTIENLPDLENISEEEFNNLKTNFNIPSIGKFTTNFLKVQKTNKFKEIVNGKAKYKKSNTST